MTPDQLQAAIISGTVSILVVVLGAWLTQRGNLRTTKTEVESSPYGELAKRVTELEVSNREQGRALREQDATIAELREEVDELRQARDEDRAYIRRVLVAWSLHLPDVMPPQPLPQWYLPHPSQQPKEQP